MACENLVIIDRDFDIFKLIKAVYKQNNISVECKDARFYKFKSNQLPDKETLKSISEQHSDVKFIVSFFSSKYEHYDIGYLTVKNGEIEKEKIWSSQTNSNDSANYAKTFVSRLYPHLYNDIFANTCQILPSVY